MFKDKKYKGFSLIEILIVVGLILILAAVTIVAINPAKHFRDTRNSQRSADISEILNAVTQFTAEEGETLANLATLGGATIPVCDTTDDPDRMIGTDVGNIDLGVLAPEFIVDIPQDPTSGNAGSTGYRICQTDGGRVEIRGMQEDENGHNVPIMVQR